ncbi:MAG: hypothetical protein HY303_04475 [Candidatus Wallbacteria bacterium]|nr:hypothetical protein [Candidatus Wallbacteria bacterium]
MMKHSVVALVSGLVCTAAAFGLEVDFSWRWPGLCEAGRFNEMVVRVPQRFEDAVRADSARLDLGAHADTAERVTVRVIVREGRYYERAAMPIAQYTAVLRPSDPAAAEASVPIYVPPGQTRFELAVELPDGTATRRIVDGLGKESGQYRGSEVRTLVVSPSGTRQLSAAAAPLHRYLCHPSALPASPAAYWVFDRVLLRGVAESDFAPGAFEALRTWAMQGGVIVTDGSVEGAFRGPQKHAFEETVLGLAATNRFLTGRFGFGRVYELSGQVPATSGLASDFPEGTSTALTPQSAGAAWRPEGSLYRERRAGYFGWLVPYGVALVGMGLLLMRRKADRFLRLAPALAVVFVGLYWVAFAAQRAEIRIARSRFLAGQAGSRELASTLFLSAFSPVEMHARVRLPGDTALPPFEAARDHTRSRTSEPSDAAVLDREEGGWTLSFGLLPAQVRSFIQRMSSIHSEGMDGALRVDLAGRRWTGEAVSRLSFPLDEAHLVHGWHHQKLGRMEPGSRVSLSLPFVDALQEDRCARHGSVRHCDHATLCASCGRYHAISGAWRSVFAPGQPELDLVSQQLAGEAERAPHFFRQPMLIGLRRPTEPGGEYTVVAIELPVEPLAGAVKLPGLVSVRQWTTQTTDEPDYHRAGRHGSPTEKIPSVNINIAEPMRFWFPFRGRATRLTVDLGNFEGSSAGGNTLIGVWNVNKGAYEDFLRHKSQLVVIDERANEFVDARDGSVTVKLSNQWATIEKVDIALEGSAP